MKFTALPVKEGDSFLLETCSNNILVDTGIDENECKNFLSEKKIEKLNLVIITHYDKDHVNGLLNLIKSEIIIAEIWLPENFGRISKTLKQEKNNLLKKIIEGDNRRNGEKEEITIDTLSIENNNNLLIRVILDKDNESNSIIHIKHYPNNETKECPEEIFVGRNDENVINVFQPTSNIHVAFINMNHINNIVSIVEECEKKLIKIRWLKYTGEFENEIINKNINIVSLNCKENKNIKEYSDDFEMMFYLTRINRESLVFKYHNDKTPNILFSADSGFEFLNKNEKIDLYKNSLVTAAHHGSKDELNVKTYSLVNGQDLIYVRSDSVNEHRPCSEYINLNKKYCTICIYMDIRNKKRDFSRVSIKSMEYK